MAFPKSSEIDQVLLQVLADLGGHARPQDVYPHVAEFFPQLTPEDLEARLPNSPTTKKWWNMVQWAKQRLQDNQCVDGTPNRFEGEWEISEKGRQTLQLNPPARPSGNLPVKHGVVQETTQSANLFSVRTFELLAALTATPTAAFYEQHQDEFKKEVEVPLRSLFKLIQGQMPQAILDTLETEKRILAQIRKNDYGVGGAHNYLWGAFYAKVGKRTESAQLFLTITKDDLEVGFYIGDYGKEQRDRFVRNCKTHLSALAAKLEPGFKAENVRYGVRGRK
jgi:Mrr N-terminal domain